jgi:hypothetical protein
MEEHLRRLHGFSDAEIAERQGAGQLEHAHRMEHHSGGAHFHVSHRRRGTDYEVANKFSGEHVSWEPTLPDASAAVQRLNRHYGHGGEQ